MKTAIIVLAAATITGCASTQDAAKLESLTAAASHACAPIGIEIPSPDGNPYRIQMQNPECGKAIGAIATTQTGTDRAIAATMQVFAVLAPIAGQVYINRSNMGAQVRMSASSEETQRSMWSTFRDAALQGNTHQFSYSYSDSSDHSAHHHSTAPPPQVVQVPTQVITDQAPHPAPTIVDREVPIVVQQPSPYPVPGDTVIVRPEIVRVPELHYIGGE
jgi:hypothetical protein